MNLKKYTDKLYIVKDMIKCIKRNKRSKLDKILTIILLIFLMTSIIGVVYIFENPKPTEYFTEFYILGSSGKAYNYPTKLFVGENSTVVIGIVNHEGKKVNYYIEVYLVNVTYTNNTNNINDSETCGLTINNIKLVDRFNITLLPKSIALKGNWTPQWEKNYTFNINKPGKWQLWFLLFKNRIPKESNSQKIYDAINNKKGILSLRLNIYCE